MDATTLKDKHHLVRSQQPKALRVRIQRSTSAHLYAEIPAEQRTTNSFAPFLMSIDETEATLLRWLAYVQLGYGWLIDG